MKRIQYFNNLPEIIKHQAIANYQIFNDTLDYHKHFDSLEECLTDSFAFESSKEDSEYWWSVCKG